MNDKDGKVMLVFDKALLQNEYLFFHPNTNTQSTVIKTADLLRAMEYSMDRANTRAVPPLSENARRHPCLQHPFSKRITN